MFIYTYVLYIIVNSCKLFVMFICKRIYTCYRKLTQIYIVKHDLSKTDAPFWGGVAFKRGHMGPRKAVVILPSNFLRFGATAPCVNYLFLYLLAEQRVSACTCTCTCIKSLLRGLS